MTRRPLIADGDVPTRSLVAVVAILTFISALAVGLATDVVSQALAWRGALVGEATVQVRPSGGRDLAADLDRAVALARKTDGVVSAQPLEPAEAVALLEPWLGPGARLPDLPVPRLVRLRLGRSPDLDGLAAALRAEVPGAELDDHGRWLSRLSWGAAALAGGALAVALSLVAAVGLAVTFAARGLAAANRRTIEILALLGADDRFVARAVARRFLRLGGTGATIGFAAALPCLAGLAWADASLAGAGPSPAPGFASLALLTAATAFGAAIVAAAVPLATVKGFVDRRVEGYGGRLLPRDRPNSAVRWGRIGRRTGTARKPKT